MILALVLVPALAGLAAFAVRADGVRRALLAGTACVHAALAAAAFARPPREALGGWLALDAPGLLFLGLTSGLFLAAAVYAIGYLRQETPGARHDMEEALFFTNLPEAVFTGCLLLFLAMMTLVTVSHHLGLLWVAVEATTLSSAPLIYFHRHHRSLEATWKYLLLCSVGIALALLGNYFLVVAASAGGGGHVPLIVDDLVARAHGLDARWLKVAFLLLFVGYGTKMGLAPLHAWLPDAHSESPSVVSALLSGALLNCAFLGILRVHQVVSAAGLAAFGREIFLVFGLLSMAVAGVFILRQADYKRMLAYSSVEHVGILAVGVGLGGAGTFGAMLHAVNHTLAKGMLFFAAGNILAAYRTKSTEEVRGVLRALPATGALWVAGFFAITGSPPFGPFLSELTILSAAIAGGRTGVAVAYLALLALAFVGMATAALRMAQGTPVDGTVAARRESWFAVGPPAALALGVLVLGLYIPPGLLEALRAAAAALGG